MDAILKDTLLLVGDADSDRVQLRRVFSSSYNILEAGTVAQACMLVRQNRACIAAVVADVSIDAKEELTVLGELCGGDKAGEDVPLILLVEPTGTGAREELAFALGASDVIVKPYTVSGVLNRVGTLVDLYLHKNHLEHLVRRQSESISQANQTLTDALSTIIEYRSVEAGNHIQRIRRFTHVLLEEVRRSCPEYELDERKIDLIARASALHDVGKIAVPDDVLNKPGRLIAEEFEIIQKHTVDGGRMIEMLSGAGDVDFLRYAYNIAVGHHERWDGSGYPRGLKGNEIPFCAHVVGIVDAFDALISERVYKNAYPCERAVDMILNGECGAFSPKLLECFKHVRKEMIAVANYYEEGYSVRGDELSAPLPEDISRKKGLDTLELLQVKYQTLVHHHSDMVMEIDLDNRRFYVVYNPLPEFESITDATDFEEMFHRFGTIGVHPDDMEMMRNMDGYFRDGFFDNNQSRHSFRCRYFSDFNGGYVMYEITIHRVYTGEEDRRLMMAIWHRVEEQEADLPRRGDVSACDLVGSGVRCLRDGSMSILSSFGMYHLCGYTDQELRTKAEGKFLSLVVPEDRDKVLRACSVSTVDDKLRLEFRIRHKDGRILHMLDQYRNSGYDSKDAGIHLLTDVTHLYEAVARRENEDELNRVVVELSGSITFDWDFKNDRITCSPLWEKRVGGSVATERFSKQLELASHFHPDDIPLIAEQRRLLKNGAQQVSFEARIADRNGGYTWNRIRARGFFDESGALCGVKGYVSDIDSLKSAAVSMQYQAETDVLTGLRNKYSVERAVGEYLQHREPDSISALLVMDLDNFKQVNDTYGHLSGDNLLMQVGTTLRKLFRADDVIGRIGGDEFVILLKDIPNREMVSSRCQLLRDTFEVIFKKIAGDLPVSFSIGVAMVPDHGTVYSELFENADRALYLAKNEGKNDYRVFVPEMRSSRRATKGGHRITIIDSDGRPGMADNSLAISAFNQLYDSRDISATIQSILSQIGEQLNVSRVYIFENNDDNTTCSNTFEWCNAGISAQKENLQDVSYITDVPGWPEMFDESGLFYCTDVTLVKEPFRSILEPQGIKSMLSCSIVDDDVFRGYVGFDECQINRVWTKEQIELLRTISRLLAVFLLKRRAQQKAQAQLANTSHVLDHLDAWIYVIDPDTCEIKFSNAKARQFSAGSSKRTGYCHEVFMNRSDRCPGCPALGIRELENQASVMHNPRIGNNIHASATLVDWDGKKECMMICREITE